MKTATGLTADGVKRSIVFEKGTLVLTNSGATLGIPKILGITGCMNDGVAAMLELHSSVSRDFLYFFLLTSTRHLRQITKIGGQPNLNTGIISGLIFALPPLEEQDSIARSLKSVKASIAASIQSIEHEIALLREYRTRLIADVVTGQVDVRGAAVGLAEEAEEVEELEEIETLEDDEEAMAGQPEEEEA